MRSKIAGTGTSSVLPSQAPLQKPAFAASALASVGLADPEAVQQLLTAISGGCDCSNCREALKEYGPHLDGLWKAWEDANSGNGTSSWLQDRAVTGDEQHRGGDSAGFSSAPPPVIPEGHAGTDACCAACAKMRATRSRMLSKLAERRYLKKLEEHHGPHGQGCNCSDEQDSAHGRAANGGGPSSQRGGRPLTDDIDALLDYIGGEDKDDGSQGGGGGGGGKKAKDKAKKALHLNVKDKERAGPTTALSVHVISPALNPEVDSSDDEDTVIALAAAMLGPAAQRKLAALVHPAAEQQAAGGKGKARKYGEKKSGKLVQTIDIEKNRKADVKIPDSGRDRSKEEPIHLARGKEEEEEGRKRPAIVSSGKMLVPPLGKLARSGGQVLATAQGNRKAQTQVVSRSAAPPSLPPASMSTYTAPLAVLAPTSVSTPTHMPAAPTTNPWAVRITGENEGVKAHAGNVYAEHGYGTSNPLTIEAISMLHGPSNAPAQAGPIMASGRSQGGSAEPQTPYGAADGSHSSVEVVGGGMMDPEVLAQLIGAMMAGATAGGGVGSLSMDFMHMQHLQAMQQHQQLQQQAQAHMQQMQQAHAVAQAAAHAQARSAALALQRTYGAWPMARVSGMGSGTVRGSFSYADRDLRFNASDVLASGAFRDGSSTGAGGGADVTTASMLADLLGDDGSDEGLGMDGRVILGQLGLDMGQNGRRRYMHMPIEHGPNGGIGRVQLNVGPFGGFVAGSP